MISPEQIDRMQTGWVQGLQPFGAGYEALYAVFDQLIVAYQEPHRHYHNLVHISEMFKVVNKLSAITKNSTAVRLAIWFHDVIYDPKAKDNEERSADWANQQLAKLLVPTELRQSIQAMILATKHTSMIPSDPDTMVLLDADLAILGAEEKRYQRYAEAIRQEYAWVEESTYRSGRAVVLQSFLQRPRIYLTDPVFEMGEAVARQNLQREIDSLRLPSKG